MSLLPFTFTVITLKNMNSMKTENISAFNIVGLAVRTTNENGQAAKDIPELWQTFMASGMLEKIPNKLGQDIYCMYTDYEKDHTKPYTTILGCKVANLDQIPDGMVGKAIAAENYSKQVAKGNINEGLVYNAWLKIWDSGLERKFTADFEIYGEKAANPSDAEVDIFVAIK